MRRGVVVEGQDQSKKEPQLKHGCYEVFRVKGLGIGPRMRGEKRRGRISKEKMGGDCSGSNTSEVAWGDNT